MSIIEEIKNHIKDGAKFIHLYRNNSYVGCLFDYLYYCSYEFSEDFKDCYRITLYAKENIFPMLSIIFDSYSLT